MKLCISDKISKLNGVSVDELFLMLLLNLNIDLEKSSKELVNKGFATKFFKTDEDYNWELSLTDSGLEKLSIILADSEMKEEPKDELADLASKLKEIFPKGKKDGTNYYWAEGNSLIIRRLKLFFKKYGNNYSHEQIIKAAENYVKSFNGDYRFMKLLKYFIFKEKIGVGGDVEGESELVNYIENEGQEDLKDDWCTNLR